MAWNDHSLPITAIYCGSGGINGRVVTVSKDQTCKVQYFISLYLTPSTPSLLAPSPLAVSLLKLFFYCLGLGHFYEKIGGLPQIPIGADGSGDGPHGKVSIGGRDGREDLFCRHECVESGLAVFSLRSKSDAWDWWGKRLCERDWWLQRGGGQKALGRSGRY